MQNPADQLSESFPNPLVKKKKMTLTPVSQVPVSSAWCGGELLSGTDKGSAAGSAPEPRDRQHMIPAVLES